MNTQKLDFNKVIGLGQKVLVEGTEDGGRVTRETLARDLRKQMGLSYNKQALPALIQIVTASVHLGLFDTPVKTFQCKRGRGVGGIVCMDIEE